MKKTTLRRFRAWSLWVAVIALAAFAQAHAKTLGDAFKEVNTAVVEIQTVERSVPQRLGVIPTSIGGLGSGVLVSPDRVLTASHVIDVADHIRVIGRTLLPQVPLCGGGDSETAGLCVSC